MRLFLNFGNGNRHGCVLESETSHFQQACSHLDGLNGANLGNKKTIAYWATGLSNHRKKNAGHFIAVPFDQRFEIY